MSHPEFIEWPFFEERHRALHARLAAWLHEAPLPRHLPVGADTAALDAHCRAWVRGLGEAGWLAEAIAGVEHGGRSDTLDTRSLCLLRETLAAHDGLADFAFAMQGLGSGALSLDGSAALRSCYLPAVARGEKIAAFALSEPEAGSDVAAMCCTARRSADGTHWVLDGEKTWISNGGIADFYVVFARDLTGSPPDADPAAANGPHGPHGAHGARGAHGGHAPPPPRGTRDIAAFVVDADAPGLRIAERIDVVAPHPLARLAFEGCRVPDTHCLAGPGAGFKLAMRTLDVFRTSVAAAALGFARHALAAARARAMQRHLFDQRLADFQLTQARLADMATTVDAAALLTYRAAWRRDQGHLVTKEAAMAKMAATEGAQRVIDAAVQIFGGEGVRAGSPVERLYREIRALRIYEGATEVQQLIIARELLKD